MAAASKGYKEIVETLLKYNADPNLRDRKNKTALSYATNDTKDLLIAAGGAF
jgi:ankyrin repeat protein